MNSDKYLFPNDKHLALLGREVPCGSWEAKQGRVVLLTTITLPQPNIDEHLALLGREVPCGSWEAKQGRVVLYLPPLHSPNQILMSTLPGHLFIKS